MAVVYSLFVSLVVYRSLTLRDLFRIFADASESSAVVMIIVAFATLFAWAGSTVGMLMDPVTIYYLLLPVLLPIIAHLRWDLVWSW